MRAALNIVPPRIIESLRLEKTHRINQSNHSFALHQWFLLNHVPQHNIQTLFEHHQARRLHHLSGQPIPVPDHPFREVVFPNVQPEPPLAQLEVLSLHLVLSLVTREKRLTPSSLQPPFRGSYREQ